MNKSQLIDAIAKETKLTKTDAEQAINSLFGQIEKTLKKGQDVRLTGFGRWYVSKRKARTGRNPQTGAAIKIPARKVPAFRAGNELKTAVR
ncbi:MAG: DNA-binding protein HU [Deltaproteobacteria bacterium RIFCSPHIGHO2_12_FULL_43_9]|nr:MAG: DNA-binding protein HU [Deltaproteobacteria bacterium RIFCSPHIGHO2_12_FULL_43_9]